ncbi:hypothetical protein [Legionella sp. W05-934-2]|uniref:hypothetical protein n=1 Tax=Legionella sp. W05-934-2 TaxID=1198649 RepID=UPI0034631348
MTNITATAAQEKIVPFYAHKKSFFDGSAKNEVRYAALLSDHMTSSELFVNQDVIHQEFDDLSAVLDTMNVDENTEQFFYFSLYCCYLLEKYHAACGDFYKTQHYKQKAQALIDKLNRVENVQNVEQRKQFLAALSQTFQDTWDEAKQSVLNPGKFAQTIGYINLSRIVLVLSRLSLSQVFVVLEENKILEKLGKLLNRNITSAEIIAKMGTVSGLFNALSVIMFGSRLVRNLAATFYFTFCPTEEAKKALPDVLSRLYHQLYQKKGALLNDSVWVVINGVTNYQLFGMSAFASMGITAGFMFFDVAVLLYLKYCDEQVYIKKQQQYDQEIKALLDSLSAQSLSEVEKNSLLMQLKVLEKQKMYNQINWRQTAAVYNFQTLAALMLGTGFSFSILVASPIVVIACYSICLVAVSMILAGNDYGKLQAIKGKIEHADALELDKAVLEKEYQQARQDLVKNLVKNTVVPSILIGTFLVCWEAALVLTVSYLVVEGFKYYQQHIAANLVEEADKDVTFKAQKPGFA